MTPTYPTRSIKVEDPTYYRLKRRARREGRTLSGLLRLLSFAPTPPLKPSSDA